MKKNIIVLFLIGFTASVYTQNIIKDITFENYPRVDGSTSTYPLSKIIACKLLNIEYEWINQNIWYPIVLKYEYLVRTCYYYILKLLSEYTF